MKKLIICIALLAGITLNCKSQEQATPILIPGSGPQDHVTFYTELIQKTRIITPVYAIIFDKEYSYGDSTKVVIQNIELKYIHFEGNVIDSYTISTGQATETERYVWEICNGIVKQWLTNQPYRKYINTYNKTLSSLHYAIPMIISPLISPEQTVRITW